MPLIRSMLVSRTFAALYTSSFTLLGFNAIKQGETNKKYPARQVDYWYGTCMPMFEYRSRAAMPPKTPPKFNGVRGTPDKKK